jgi:OCT family organic cation transporter-like MFS transporter 4/5
MQVVFGVLVGVAPDVYTYMLSRLVVGATTSGVFLVAYVLGIIYI